MRARINMGRKLVDDDYRASSLIRFISILGKGRTPPPDKGSSA
jgi:hypothetical protein